MAVDSVRRLSGESDLEPLPGGTLIEFRSDEWRKVAAPDLIKSTTDFYDQYRYSGQLRRYANFEFTTDPMFGAPKTAEGVLEYRTDSDFVFIILDQDTPSPDTIFSELRENEEFDFPIELDFSPTFGEVCDFIRSADSIVKLRTPARTSSPVDDIKQGENIPVELARLRFTFEGNSQSVAYSDGQLSLSAQPTGETLLDAVSRRSSLREYVIQLFEMAFAADS